MFWLVTTHNINIHRDLVKKERPKNLPTEDDSLFRLISLITPLPDMEEFVFVEKAKWDFVAAVLASFESLKCHFESSEQRPTVTQ